MLLDIKNESKEDEIKHYKVPIDEKNNIEIENLPKKSSLIAIKEFKKYSDAEGQFLLPSDELRILNFSTIVDHKKSFFNLNDSWR